MFLQSERELLRYVMALVPNPTDARDILQETAIALWNAIDKYDPGRPFIPWASRFALNEARLFLRSERRRRLLEDDVADLLEKRRLDHSARFDRRRDHLLECLRRLPADEFELIRSYYFDETPITALAIQSGRTPDAIYKALQRIRLALHGCIERKLEVDS